MLTRGRMLAVGDFRRLSQQRQITPITTPLPAFRAIWSLRLLLSLDCVGMSLSGASVGTSSLSDIVPCVTRLATGVANRSFDFLCVVDIRGGDGVARGAVD